MTSVSLGNYAKYYEKDGKKLTAEQAAKEAQSLGLYGGGNYGQTISGLNCIVDGGKQFGGEATHYTVYNEETGQYEEMGRADAMADSFDSVLDVYIMEKMDEFITTECGGDSSYWWDGRGFLTDEKKQLLLDKYNIQVNQLDSRTFTFSLVDDEGNVIKDAEGNEGSCMWGDWVIPDGFAQDSERNLSSMLDMMGKECVSAADFSKNELDAMVKDIDSQLAQFNKTGQDTNFMKHSEQNADEFIKGKYTGSSSSGTVSRGGVQKTDTNSGIFDMTEYVGAKLMDSFFERNEDKFGDKQTKEVYNQIKDADEDKDGKVTAEEYAAYESGQLVDAIISYEEKFEEMKAENPDLTDYEIKETLNRHFAEKIAEKYGLDIDTLIEQTK